MTSVALVPLVLQALLMSVDEFYFHRRRGLPRWECIGHPLDTLSVLCCYALALFARPTSTALTAYVGLAAFSCLLITKDEFIHAQNCPPAEQWVHSLLFVLHPLVLGATALFWFERAATILTVQALLTLLFGCYQLLYWNTPWLRRSHAR